VPDRFHNVAAPSWLPCLLCHLLLSFDSRIENRF
jgi:hypothetical protein